jgi:splicing factor 3A subunit 1
MLALVTEDEFAARFSGAIMVQVSVPNDPSAGPWELNGQTLSLSLSVSASGRELKELLATSLGGLPINKQQVRRRDRPDLGYLKDSQTLASLNVGDGALLEMTLRSRGGKK